MPEIKKLGGRDCCTVGCLRRFKVNPMLIEAHPLFVLFSLHKKFKKNFILDSMILDVVRIIYKLWAFGNIPKAEIKIVMGIINT